VSAVGSTSTASYRADGLRASKTIGSTTTYYLYDGGEPIIELNSSGTVTAFNIFAPDGLVARTAGSTTTEYVFDQQGNVADRTNTSGAVQSVTQYDGWGNEQAISGTPSDPFGYNAQSGYYLDRETGLYLCEHRFYDPANGRWLNRDPIGYVGGTNLYGYCAGGPAGSVDVTGYLGDLPEAEAEIIWLDGPQDGMSGMDAAATAAANMGLQWLINKVHGDGAATCPGSVSGAADPRSDANNPPRSDPTTLQEQLGMGEAQSGGGSKIMDGKINDPAYAGTHQKMQYLHELPDGSSINIHYWREITTGLDSGFKFKSPPMGTPPFLNGPIISEE
jgi:RHS repeat-associated protein